MARNVEIKARLVDPEAARRRVESLTDGPPEILEQRDTFFRVARGRLKLRETAGGRSELIYYERPDDPDPVESHYEVVPIANGPALRELLARSLGVRGEVVKRRTLFHAKRTRIQLDDVPGLGAFLELEVELGDRDTVEEGKQEAGRLLRALGIDTASLVAEAYVDLFDRKDGLR